MPSYYHGFVALGERVRSVTATILYASDSSPGVFVRLAAAGEQVSVAVDVRSSGHLYLAFGSCHA